MQGSPPGALLDLLAAAEAVRQDHRLGPSLPNRGQQHPLATFFEISYLSASKPNDPAMPQQPDGSKVVIRSHAI